MKYISTRGGTPEGVSAAQAIKQGLAGDGGLFMPESLPVLSTQMLQSLCDKTYAQRAAQILGMYLTDYTEGELLADCTAAYEESRFPGGAAPLAPLSDGKRILLELWHGPTCAFKDMALQIMPKLLSRALKKTGEHRTALILVATSGDTGKAALEGYRDVDGVKIAVFYPAHGVSRVQKLQMATQEGNNVFVQSIHGNFDDAQSGVKRIFSDPDVAKRLDENQVFLSSANSINWGRLVPQIVYYISAYCDLVKNGTIRMGERIHVCVPTGNFGNIFAAYLAKRMGLPIDRLLCASNKNHILTDFLRTGVYDRNRAFYTTMSPSMDILISSNLERLLYVTFGTEKTAAWMKSLQKTGSYELGQAELAVLQKEFSGYFCEEEQTASTIREVYADSHYLCDPHTAVGVGAAKQYLDQTQDSTPILIASTASPYKFAYDVCKAIGTPLPENDLAALHVLHDVTGTPIPAPLADIERRTVRFEPEAAVEAADMLQSVSGYFGIR